MMDGSKQSRPTLAAMAHERPALLLPLFAPVRGLQGVGPALERRLARLLGRSDPTALDLITHLPSSFLETEPAGTLASSDIGSTRTLLVRIEAHHPPTSPARPLRVEATGAAGTVDLVFFGSSRAMIEARFPVGAEILVQGRLQIYGDRWQIAHPDRLQMADVGRSLPIYPATDGLTQGALRSLIRRVVAKLAPLPEWQEPEIVRAAGWVSFDRAVRAAHAGRDDRAAARLAMDELFAGQLGLLIARRARERLPGRAVDNSGSLGARLLAHVPFRLTDHQRRALQEILADMAAPTAMLRLLQGDVGSGKTLVAALAMLTAVESGHQAALMAPTDILATQHHRTLADLLRPIGIEPLLLAGRIKGRHRTAVIERLGRDEPAFLVGTHALLQDSAIFADLALAVVDEQHRFGVRQRWALRSKGHAVDLLLMTATPIPRTAAMSAYGDIATSVIAERPLGRQPIATAVVPIERIDEVVDAVGRRLDRGERVYWICPLIDITEREDRSAVDARVAYLRGRFGDLVGFAHGRLKELEKDLAMQAFADGRTPLLVATTVVEVGIDVPEATMIVIEGAERFGLAQLHQLRGRVGRGLGASGCIMVWRGPLSAAASARLAALRRTDNGFDLAEQDLRLRGPGEILGDRQSGLGSYRLADLQRHADLLPVAAASARRSLADDPTLSTERGQALRLLLHLFRRADVLGLIDGG